MTTNQQPNNDVGNLDFPELVTAVGEWAAFNFGKENEKRDGDDPFTGMVEELCDEADVIDATPSAEILQYQDAIADFFVYFADYCYVNDVCVNGLSFRDDKHYMGGTKYLGKLAHVHLKTKQGIRKFSDPVFAAEQKRTAVYELFYAVVGDYQARKLDDPLIDVINEVWDKVSQRNWKKNPDDAHIIAEGQSSQYA